MHSHWNCSKRALNQSCIKNTGSAILKGFQHLPANAVSKQPHNYSIFVCSVSSVFVFFVIFYPKNIFLYPPHPFHCLIIMTSANSLDKCKVPTEIHVSCKMWRGKGVSREAVLCWEPVQTTFLDECSTCTNRNWKQGLCKVVWREKGVSKECTDPTRGSGVWVVREVHVLCGSWFWNGSTSPNNIISRV